MRVLDPRREALRDAATEAAMRAAVGVAFVCGGVLMIVSVPLILLRGLVPTRARDTTRWGWTDGPPTA
jgi:hypothetical protein